jgi:hypothetical protein
VSAYVLTHWQAWLHLIGGAFGIVGTFLMASQYLKFDFGDQIRALVASLWRGAAAQDAAEVQPGESRIETIQGLALIAIGFIVGVLPEVVAVFATTAPAR